MARRIVMETVCDRCPRGKEKPATETVRLGLGDAKWDLKLCDGHHRDLERDVYAWARLGREVEVAQRFTAQTKEDARRIAELRSQQVEERPKRPVEEKPAKAGRLVGAIPQGLPADAGEWIFTEHAMVRMRERKITAVEALRAACMPTVVRESDRPGSEAMIYVGHGTKVVVDEVDKLILTVARPDRDDETYQRKAN